MDRRNFKRAFLDVALLPKPAEKILFQARNFRRATDKLLDTLSDICSESGIIITDFRSNEFFTFPLETIPKQGMKLVFEDELLLIAPEITLLERPSMYLQVTALTTGSVLLMKGTNFYFNHLAQEFYGVDKNVMQEGDWLLMIKECLLPYSSYDVSSNDTSRA